MKKVLIVLIVLFLTGMLKAEKNNIPAMNFSITGEMLYYLLSNQDKDDSDRFGIENIKADITGGIKFFNRRNIAGLSLIRINSDNTIYELSLYKLFVNYFTPAFKLQFFYKYRIENYNDGFRMLDDEIESFYQPIIFYKDKKLLKLGYWGKDYMGVKLILKKFIYQELILGKKIDNDAENKFSVISKTGKEFTVSDDIKIFAGLNFIYIKQDYTLPQVNSSSWAEYNGVWYEFNTNSFYDMDNDYKIKASGEFGVTLLNVLDLWGEAGIDNKYGGYYGETTQKATSSGNTNYVMILKSAGHKKFMFGGGLKLDLDFLTLGLSYKRINNNMENFTALSNLLVLSNKEVNINDINLNLAVNFNIVKSEISFSLENSGDDSHNIYFDRYNFLENVPLSVTNIMRLRCFNKIDLKFGRIYPEIEYRKYGNDLTTIEVNGGVDTKIYGKLNFYANVRYKIYNVSGTNKTFINPFLSFRYSYSKDIYFEFGYGLDNRLLYDNEYGFEYYLNDYIEEYNIDGILDAEEKITKNNYIFITGHIGF